MEKKLTRKNSTPVKVYCLPDEKIQIMAKSKAAGLTLSKYLLNVGIGYEISSILDHRRINDLARVNGDMGRLGGLLKLWLTNDERVAKFDSKTIYALLKKIEKNQDEIREIMRTVVC
jgi:hypothetical protein